jgi:hypothetical protein
MMPLIFGVIAGVLSALALTCAYHRLSPNKAMLVLIATLAVGFIGWLKVSEWNPTASLDEVLYLVPWLLIAGIGFLGLGTTSGAKLFTPVPRKACGCKTTPAPKKCACKTGGKCSGGCSGKCGGG